MIPHETYVLQHTPNPFEQKWEDLAVFTWGGKEWKLVFLKEAQVNAQLRKWCKEGILQIAETESGEEEKFDLLSPQSPGFLEKISDRLGKLKYRFVAADQAGNP